MDDTTPGAITARETEQRGRYPVQVVELRPRTFAAFRWASQFTGQVPAPGRTTLIEFTLTDLGGHVRENSGGWEEELGAAQTRCWR